MKYTIMAAALVIGGAAMAQETYDEIISSGGMGEISNMERHLATILEANGVSRECMGKLSFNNAIEINRIIDRDDDSRSEKERDIKAILDRHC